MTASHQSAGPAVSSPAEAQQLVAQLGGVMDALLTLVEEETGAVRAGRISEVVRLEPVKADLARACIADTLRLKRSAPYLKQHHPHLLEALRRRHEAFQVRLQANLTVLATAHAVSESIMRGVSREVDRKRAPQTYGASGQHAAPLSLSRSL
jgi:hypothetical protein